MKGKIKTTKTRGTELNQKELREIIKGLAGPLSDPRARITKMEFGRRLFKLPDRGYGGEVVYHDDGWRRLVIEYKLWGAKKEQKK